MVSCLGSGSVIIFVHHAGVFSDPFNKLGDTPLPTSANDKDTSLLSTISEMLSTTTERLSTTSAESKMAFLSSSAVGNNTLSSTSQSSTSYASSFLVASTTGLLQQTTSAGTPLVEVLTMLLLIYL